MQECSFIDFELDTSLFSLADCLCKIESNRASLGAGHQASRPKLFTKSSYFTHYIGCCDRDIKTDPVSFDLFYQVIQTTKSAPAASASLAFSPCAKTSTFTSLPVPAGSIVTPRTI